MEIVKKLYGANTIATVRQIAVTGPGKSQMHEMKPPSDRQSVKKQKPENPGRRYWSYVNVNRLPIVLFPFQKVEKRRNAIMPIIQNRSTTKRSQMETSANLCIPNKRNVSDTLRIKRYHSMFINFVYVAFFVAILRSLKRAAEQDHENITASKTTRMESELVPQNPPMTRQRQTKSFGFSSHRVLLIFRANRIILSSTMVTIATIPIYQMNKLTQVRNTK